MSFDLKKYKRSLNVDPEATKENVKLFLEVYRTARSKAGIYSDPEVNAVMNKVENDQTDFKNLHQLYINGMAAVEHTNPAKTDRRKQLFYLRYVLGYSVDTTAMQLSCCRSLLYEETAAAVAQFAEALNILEMRVENGV